MSAILECILHGCWEDDSDDEEENETNATVLPPNSATRMNRLNSLLYQPPNMTNSPGAAVAAASAATEDLDSTLDPNNTHRRNNLQQNISGLFQKLGEGIQKFQQNRTSQFLPLSQSPTNAMYTSSPLVTAHQFVEHHTKKQNDREDEIIPAIEKEHFVMPGSNLQKQMSLDLQSKGFGLVMDGTEECVICMEPFDATNPRMPTLCGCGENNTYFHLPCLYQWIEKDLNCPTCRQKLTWEEF